MSINLACAIIGVAAMACDGGDREKLEDYLECPGDRDNVTLCEYLNDGIDVYCATGNVYVNDRNRYVYCYQGTDNRACVTDALGHSRAYACPDSYTCSDELLHHFETYEALDGFDLRTLCGT
jgi:hypothetical protein